ncbi:MAG: hypothetical protein E6K14_03735 [Methanobacteriota archaeon]|nr:MAG: hypothetical protein E6K14_03735 [Euryarchaeota archaeon]
MDVEVPLLETYVDGLDRALGGGIPKGSTILVAGTPGTMKTSLILWLMHENARLRGTKSLYVSLEQDMDIEGLVHDPVRDHQGGGQLERVSDPRARQPRGALHALGGQDAPEGDVPLPRFAEGARPDDVPDLRDAVRLDAARAVGGRLPRGRHPEPATGRGRGCGSPAAPTVRQDALDEPRPRRARAEPGRAEVLRDPRDLEEEIADVRPG